MKSLTDIANDISTTLNDTGYELIQEDDDSLYSFLSSQKFFQDLNEYSFSNKLSPESYFTILLLQLSRQVQEKESILHIFNKNLNKTSTKQQYDGKEINNFIKKYRNLEFLVNILNYFLSDEQIKSLPGENGEYKYIFKMIKKLKNIKSNKKKYYISCHIGNFSLFKTGLCRKNIEHRNKYKNRPMTLSDYEKYGKSYYSKASNTDLAKEQKLDNTLYSISKNFNMARSTIDTVFTCLV